MNDEPDFDTPSADPQIQKDYESALGAFLVSFNGIENAINYIIRLSLKDSKFEHIKKHLYKNNYHPKVTLLLFIIAIHPRFSGFKPKETLENDLRHLGSSRNNLAHGHFDQNPFDGSYEIGSNNKYTKIPIEQIEKLTSCAEDCIHQISHISAQFLFDDLDE